MLSPIESILCKKLYNYKKWAGTLLTNSRIFFYAAIVGAIAYWLLTSYLLKADHSIAVEKQRQDIRQTAFISAQKLNAEANSAYYLASGMASYISMKPDITRDEFTRLAADIITHKDVFRNIAGAPNLVINNVYPLKGNETVLGIDYHTLPDQMVGIQKAIETKNAVLDGPIDLVQGGQGFIARFPIFYTEGGIEKFWGILSTVIDTARLYELAGLTQQDMPITIALHGTDNGGSDGVNFYGDKSIHELDPVHTPIKVPGGEWMLAAIPKDGWLSEPPNGTIIKWFSTLTLVLYLLVSLVIQLYINRLAHLRATADAANKMKSRFISNMSHEMRTPLNGIMGYASLLEKSDLTKKQAMHAEHLSQAVTALLDISNDILDLAKLEMGQVILNIHTFAIHDLIDEAINLNLNNAKAKGLYIKCEHNASSDGFTITTDGNRLRQIISNLVDNSVKFTDRGGVTLHIYRSENEDKIIIKVIDTGIGIEQDKINHIFERFEQIEDIYSRNHNGAGLGLSICRELAQLLDGNLKITSTVGAGTTATITLPIENKQAPSDSI